MAFKPVEYERGLGEAPEVEQLPPTTGLEGVLRQLHGLDRTSDNKASLKALAESIESHLIVSKVATQEEIDGLKRRIAASAEKNVRFEEEAGKVMNKRTKPAGETARIAELTSHLTSAATNSVEDQKKAEVTPTHEQQSPQLDTHLQSRLNKINNASNFLGSAAKKLWGGYVSIVEKVIPESLTDEAIEARFKRWFGKREKNSATVNAPKGEAVALQNNSAQTYQAPRPTIRGAEQPNETAIKSPDDNKAWLPYKTPINVNLFDSPIFKKVMLSLPTPENELPISGEQAYKWAMPAIQEMYRLTNTTRTPETMDAIAKLQTYLGVLQSDKEKAEFVVRARTDFLNSQKRTADQNQ